MYSLQNQPAERRKEERYQVTGKAFAENSARNGLITDISLDGLAYRYVDRKRWPEESYCLDIVLDEEDFRLRRLPFTIVNECVAAHDCPDRTLIVKERRIQFLDLTPAQRARLEYFINNHTNKG